MNKDFDFVANRLGANICHILGISLGLSKNKSTSTQDVTANKTANTDLTTNTNQSQTSTGTTTTAGSSNTNQTQTQTNRDTGSVTGQTSQVGTSKETGRVSQFTADQQAQLDSLIQSLSGTGGAAAGLGLEALATQIQKVGAFDPQALVDSIRAGANQSFKDNIAPELAVFAQNVGGTGATNGVAALINERAIGQQEARVAGATADALLQAEQTQQSGLGALGAAVTNALSGVGNLFGLAKGGQTVSEGQTETAQSQQSAEQRDLLSVLQGVSSSQTITAETMMQALQQILAGTETARGTEVSSGTQQSEGVTKGKSMGASVGFKL